MTRFNNRGLILSAVLAALPVFSAASFAQFQTGTGGHALDASNRVGSGGINQQGGSGSTNGYSNSTNVFTGNVSGLNYFHGNTNGIFDSNTVQANTETAATDNINRQTAQPIGGGQGGGANYQAYYNSSRIVAPQPGFTQTLNGAAYVPAPQYNPLTPNSDSRLGGVNLNNQPQYLLPQPGEIDMAGQVDPTGSQSLFTMSPLYGMRKNDSNDAGDSFFLSQYSNYGQTGAADRARMQPAALRRMQDELNNSALPADETPGAINPNGQTSPNTPGGANTGTSNTGTSNTGALNNGAVNNGALNNGALQASPLAAGQLPAQPLTSGLGSSQIDNSLSSGQGTQNRMLIPAGRQSAQIQALEKKFANQKLNDSQASDLYNQQQRLLRAAESKPTDLKPGVGDPNAVKPSPDTFSGTGATPGATAGAPTPPGNTVTPPKHETFSPVLTGPDNASNNTNTPAENQPYVITSLATGIKAKGLAEMLTSAEGQMRGGRFSQAIDTYNSAEQVAPNNPFVPLGRGFAELGRSYYAKADADIARAVTAEPAILAGQYDLKGFIGDARLQFIQRDLQDIATTEKSARSSVLLAFIAHNTGDDASAAKLLDDAAARGGYDAMVKQMRETWSLKAGTSLSK
jgi:hypothetical protein